MTLKEAIIYDYIGEGTLLHYTTPEALMAAIKKGKINIGNKGLNTIRPSAADKDTVANFKDPTERPGTYQKKDRRDFGWDEFHGKFNAKDEQMKYDSKNASVKIIIDGSKLKGGGARGVKIEKKNEAYKKTFQKVKHYIDTYRDDDAERFIKEVSPYINKLHLKHGGKKVSLDDLYSSVPEKERDAITKKYNLTHRGKVKAALEAAYNHRGSQAERKGTETINFKKKSKFSSIPVDYKFVKFELVKRPILNDFNLVALAKHIKDNKKLFKENDILKKIVKDAAAIERGEKPEREKSPIKIKKKFKKEKSAYHDSDSKEDKKKGFKVI